MRLMSVNVGQRRTQVNGKEVETTGIYKVPTVDAVRVSALGIPHDVVCDQKNHGGPDQAIYVYGTTDYEWWSKELNRTVEPGTFGENLTVTGLESSGIHIGDRLRVGSVILEVTAPRFPCSTLAARMKDPAFVRKYRRAQRPGVYCRVIVEGTLQVGQAVLLENHAGETVSVLELFEEHYKHRKSEPILRRALGAPISNRVRLDLERDLRKVLGSRGKARGSA